MAIGRKSEVLADKCNVIGFYSSGNIHRKLLLTYKQLGKLLITLQCKLQHLKNSPSQMFLSLIPVCVVKLLIMIAGVKDVIKFESDLGRLSLNASNLIETSFVN